jgi:hypothetical protein
MAAGWRNEHAEIFEFVEPSQPGAKLAGRLNVQNLANVDRTQIGEFFEQIRKIAGAGGRRIFVAIRPTIERQRMKIELIDSGLLMMLLGISEAGGIQVAEKSSPRAVGPTWRTPGTPARSPRNPPPPASRDIGDS